MNGLNIVIRGHKQTPAVATNAGDVLELEASYTITGVSRGDASAHKITLNREKLLEFIFEDETTWMCSDASINELFPELDAPGMASAVRGGDGAFEIPAALKASGTERGLVTNVAIKLINVFAKKKIGITVEKAARNYELKNLGNVVGLFKVDTGFHLHEFREPEPGKPVLLLIHGTASSVWGCFGSMKNTELWKYLCQTYGNNIYAFQHETLSKSPLDNIRELVGLLPSNLHLHIITHSRGGLLGDVLSRFTDSDAGKNGFTDEELALLEKEKRHADLRNIEAITKLMAGKQLHVERFIRVACPAAGTILASKRLDIYFNVIANLTGLLTGSLANPLFTAFRELIASVIDTKDDSDVLPGIEAMNPESPFLKVLNNPSTSAPLNNQLVVVAGNCGLNFSMKALKILAVRLFFLEANDLVVNSDSMYLGAKRKMPVQYFFDEADDVDHFSYFRNKKTGQAMMRAFQTQPDKPVPGYALFNSPSSEEALRNALFNPEGGELFPDEITGKRPIAVLLPGIMGSNIGPKGDLLWINYWKFIKGGLKDLNDLEQYTATSVVKTSYKKLKDELSAKYDVETFHFDWRCPLTEVAAIFNERIKQLMAFGQPIKLIGHSMGGVVIRDFMVNHRETWQQLNNSASFRLIFLGSPLGGSFRIPYVLFGKDSIIKKLAMIDMRHSKKELLRVFSGMQGLLSLLPLDKNNAENDFGNGETWRQMAQAAGDSSWPLPPANAIKAFADYRDGITDLSADDFKNAVYIAGKDKSTPCGYRIENGQLVFLSTAEGDQSVTWETGIPALMTSANNVYYVNVSHGALANEPSMFKGIGEILETGTTNLLSKKRPVVRGEEKVFRTPEVHDFDTSMIGLEKTLLGLGGETTGIERGETPIRVWVSNGDLSYAANPVLAGHFEDDGVLYAESYIDALLDGALRKRHQLGLYPGKIGTSEVFLPDAGRFTGAIITGLGKPGTLTAHQLTLTVEQGVTNYLLGFNSGLERRQKKNDGSGISSLIIGCGYGGLSVENSIRAILQGVQNANVKMAKLYGTHCRMVEDVEFVEKDHSRALGCFYSLARIEQERNRWLNITLPEKKIRLLLGRTKRIPHDASEEWWNRITVRQYGMETLERKTISSLHFSASTGGAREEVRVLHCSMGIIDELVNNISTSNEWTPQRAKTIFELLIPNDFKEQLKRQCHISWILDKETAAYPWELLQDTIQNAKPLCISAGMIRQLATEQYRTIINPAVKNKVLIIAEPQLNGAAPALPAAKEEGLQVADILKENGYETKLVAEAAAPEIIQALYEDDYRIIHLAGHGFFNEQEPENSGMMIGHNVYLSTREIAQMSVVPELVVVNCCFLGKTSGAAEALYNKRYRLAANIGTQLIENGVKAVVAAGWAVNDAAAQEFTNVFYKHLFDGYNFGEAVLEARKAVFTLFPGTNTWGAYQCYGDPFFKLKANGPSRKEARPLSYVISEEAEYDLFNLLNELEMGNRPVAEYNRKLVAIMDAVDRAGIRNAEITEKEAWVLTELASFDEAIVKYEQLLRMEKALFTFLSMERYCDIRGRKLLRDLQRKLITAAQAEEGILRVIADLGVLINAGGTAERFGLLARTYKRKALMTNQSAARTKLLEKAAALCYQAYQVAGKGENMYALTAWLEMESVLVLVYGRKWGQSCRSENLTYTLPQAEDVLKLLEQSATTVYSDDDEFDYNDMVSATHIELCRMLVGKASGGEEDWSNIMRTLQSIWEKAGSPGKKIAETERWCFLAHALSRQRKDIAYEFIPEGNAGMETISVYVEMVREVLKLRKKNGGISVKKAPVKKAAPKKSPAKKRVTKK